MTLNQRGIPKFPSFGQNAGSRSRTDKLLFLRQKGLPVAITPAKEILCGYFSEWAGVDSNHRCFFCNGFTVRRLRHSAHRPLILPTGFEPAMGLSSCHRSLVCRLFHSATGAYTLDGIRTHTEPGLNRMPLPVGLQEHGRLTLPKGHITQIGLICLLSPQITGTGLICY